MCLRACSWWLTSVVFHSAFEAYYTVKWVHPVEFMSPRETRQSLHQWHTTLPNLRPYMSTHMKIVQGIELYGHWMGHKLCGHSDITHRVFTGIWFISSHTTLKLSSFGYESANHKVSFHIHGPKSRQNETVVHTGKGGTLIKASWHDPCVGKTVMPLKELFHKSGLELGNVKFVTVPVYAWQHRLQSLLPESERQILCTSSGRTLSAHFVIRWHPLISFGKFFPKWHDCMCHFRRNLMRS